LDDTRYRLVSCPNSEGIEHYEKMFPDQELPADIRSLIETKLLPARQLHISILEGLLEIVTTAK